MSTHRLGYDLHGPADAPVLVLGSSLGTDRTMWDPQLPVLSESLRVVRFDHLGHGESAVPPGPYTLGQLAGELVALLDDLGIARAHLGGLSLGGMVAMQLAATVPERVGRLVLVCTSAHMPPAQAWRDRANTVREQGMAAIADAVLQRWFTPEFTGRPEAVRLRDGLVATPPEGYAGCCEAIAEMDLRPLLPRIQAPTLVIAGTADPATPVDHARTIVDGIRSGSAPAALEVVEGAAHLGSVERPEDVGRLMVKHVQ